jgi:hypothetical protein
LEISDILTQEKKIAAQERLMAFAGIRSIKKYDGGHAVTTLLAYCFPGKPLIQQNATF